MSKDLTIKDKQIARDILYGLTIDQIAEKSGLHPRTIDRRKASPEMQAYMEDLKREQAEVFTETVKAVTREQVVEMKLTPVTRPMIISRLWELAMLDPRYTKRSILGQQRALDSVWAKSGFEGPAPRIGDPDMPEKPDVYQAEWMRKPPQ